MARHSTNLFYTTSNYYKKLDVNKIDKSSYLCLSIVQLVFFTSVFSLNQMNKFALFIILIQLVEFSYTCFTKTTAPDNQKQAFQDVIENQLASSNLILIPPKKNCSSTGSFDQVFICYNTGTCHTKNVFVNLTHYQQVSYCKCPVVS